MTMAQVENDHPMTNGCENTNGDLHIEPIDLSSPISNGIVGTPSKCVEGNGELTDGQLSPASLRRRSTRVSALKAQEKIKLKDDIVAAGQLNRGSHDEDDDDESAPKKRRLDDGSAFDQFSHKFGIRQQEDNVYPLTDESEISSLHESEIVGLKVSYDKLMSKELSEEQKRERNMMIKKCEAELRLEEAKLTMLKKIKASQMLATQKLNESKKLLPNIALNNVGGAYKPLVATPIGNKPSATTATTNGKSSSSSSSRANPLLGLAGFSPQQQQELLSRAAAINPAAVQALLVASSKSGQTPTAALAALFAAHQQQTQLKEQQLKEQQQLKDQQQNSQASTAAQQAKVLAAQTPQQRAAAARQAFRMQADKQLMQQIAAPKAPPTDLFFIPNGNQPDFCYLVGLDLVVQRVLRDKNVHRPVTNGPYECEECGTDFTPSWKAIGTSEADLHLYCEQCVRTAQKKKIRTDHTNLLKKAYNKINSQEKEFEKQIADGKLDAALAAAAAQQAQAAQVQASSSASTSQSHAQNLSTKVQSGTTTPTVQKSSTPVPPSSIHSATKTASSSSSSCTPQNNSKKGSSASSMNLNSMQQQMAMMAQLARSNPMMAAMMNQMNQVNSMNNNQMANMMQMWNPLVQAQAAAAANQLRMQQAQQANQPNLAMSLLAQAVQSANAQSHSGSGGQANNAFTAQLAAAAMNPAALMSNPALLRQFQQMNQQNRNLIESMRGKK